jgi:protein-S-isoprenylcysteine O-methyltransferase Ste14
MPASSGSGSKGGAWVAGQFALMAAAVAGGFVGGWPEDLEGTFDAIGAVLAVAGAALATWAARALGSSLTCYPKPRERGKLVEAGPYRFSRHPIYSGGIYFFVGWGLWSSPLALAFAVALAVLWALKARFEEQLLAERYPGYDDYRRRTHWRLLPGIY